VIFDDLLDWRGADSYRAKMALRADRLLGAASPHQGSKLRIARKMSMPVKSSGRAHSSSSGVFINADS
jgi:hypothetical protein